MKKVRLKDIAEEVGCSQSLISGILNGIPQVRCSPEMKKRIDAAIKKFNYEPPQKRAKKIKSKYLAFLMPDYFLKRGNIDTSLAAFLAGALSKTATYGYEVLLIPLNFEEESKLSSTIMEKRASGVFVAIDSYLPEETLKFMKENKIPYAIGEVVKHANEKPVTKETTSGIENAIDYLWQLGHRKIAFLEKSSNFPERFEALKNRLNFHGLTCEKDQYIKLRENEEFMQLAEQRQKGNLDFTAVITSGDSLAVDLINAMENCRLNIPRDVSVIGFDDNLCASVKGLSSIHKPLEMIGEMTVDRVIQLINLKTDMEFPVNRLQTDLIIRNTTAPVAGKK